MCTCVCVRVMYACDPYIFSWLLVMIHMDNDSGVVCMKYQADLFLLQSF